VAAKIISLRDGQKDLAPRLGNEVVKISGTQFKSLQQTINLVRYKFHSHDYFLFQYPVTLPDMIWTTHLSDKDLMKKSSGRFFQILNIINDTAVRLTVSFGRTVAFMVWIQNW